MTMPSENPSESERSEKAPTNFLNYQPPKAVLPHGLQVAGPRDHKPLYKMIKSLLKPKTKIARVKQPKWKKKYSYK